MALLEVGLLHGDLAVGQLLQSGVVLLQRVVECLHALVFADVRPRVLHVRHHALVYCGEVGLSKVAEHLARELLPVERLRLYPVNNLAPELHDLFHKLGPELLQLHVLQVLQIFLLGHWPNHGATVAVREERLHHSPYPVLLLNAVGEAFLRLERLFKIILGGKGFALLVDELEREVAHDPHEGWEVAGIFLWVHVFPRALRLDVDVLG